MLEYELKQMEDDLRHQLIQYQREKSRIEQNLNCIRLQQRTNNTATLIQEL